MAKKELSMAELKASINAAYPGDTVGLAGKFWSKSAIMQALDELGQKAFLKSIDLDDGFSMAEKLFLQLLVETFED